MQTRIRRIFTATLSLALIATFALSPMAQALSEAQDRIYDNDVHYLDVVDEVSCPTPEAGAATGVDTSIESDNVKIAYDYFVGKGLAPFRSAAIVGNFQIEAPGLNPHTNQAGGGVGRGIAQWSLTGRWAELQTWAQKNGGRDIYDINTQLDFVWYEMNNVAPWNKSLPAINKETNMNRQDGETGATQAFMETYEKPGVPNLNAREAAASKVLELYGAGAASTGPSVGTTTDPTSDDTNEAGSDACAAAEGNFTGTPGQTKKLGKGFTLKDNTDYSATPCAPGSTEQEIYTHPVAHFKIRLCVINGSSTDVNSIVSERVVSMYRDAKADGVPLNGGGFRKYEEQIALRKQNCPDYLNSDSSACSPPTAKAGNSQHERGLAIDMTGSGGGTIRSGSEQWNWLVKNAAKYGYYNLPSENWHWSTSGN